MWRAAREWRVLSALLQTESLLDEQGFFPFGA